jgi:hypothetical protein
MPKLRRGFAKILDQFGQNFNLIKVNVEDPDNDDSFYSVAERTETETIPIKAYISEKNYKLFLERYGEYQEGDIEINVDQDVDIEINDKLSLPYNLPDDVIFFISYKRNVNADFGVGDLTGTPIDGAEVVDGFLDLSYEDGRRVTYNALNNISSAHSIGAIRFTIIPNEADPVSPNLVFLQFSDAEGSQKNRFEILQQTDGGLGYIYADKNGDNVGFRDIADYFFVPDEEHEMEFNYDFIAGYLNILVNGVFLGSVENPVFVRDRDSNIGYLSIGVDPSRFKCSNVTFFNQIQHTESYTPETFQNKEYEVRQVDSRQDGGIVYKTAYARLITQ